MKRFVCIALLLCILCSMAVTAGAEELETGTIEVRVQYQGENVTGGDLIAVRVGYLDVQHAVFRRVTNGNVITGIGSADAVTRMQNFYSAYKNSEDG